MASPYDWVEKMITDFKDIANGVADTVVWYVDASGDALAGGYKDVVSLQGDPESIREGARIINDDVKGQLEDALSDLEAGTDGVNFRDSWKGGGANAFRDYLPRLKNGYSVLITNCTDVADSLSAYANGLELLYAEIIEGLSELASTLSGLEVDLKGDDENKKEKAKSKAQGAIKSFTSLVSAISTLWTTALKTDSEVANLIDKMEDYKKLDVLVNVKGGDPRFYTGPTGEQLPMPTDVSIDPDWSKDDIKDRWKLESDGELKIEFEPFMAMVSSLRKNGEYWSKADKKLIEAWVDHLPQEAFSTVLSNANKYYSGLEKVLTARHLTFLHSPDRLHELGDVLDKIAEAYGQDDGKSSDVIGSYLEN